MPIHSLYGMLPTHSSTHVSSLSGRQRQIILSGWWSVDASSQGVIAASPRAQGPSWHETYVILWTLRKAGLGPSLYYTTPTDSLPGGRSASVHTRPASIEP